MSHHRLTPRQIVAAILLLGSTATAVADVSLLNVSYDPTRELYQDFNAAFARHWLSVV